MGAMSALLFTKVNMPKEIEKHAVRLQSAVSTGVKPEEDWAWRKFYIGMSGTLTIYESETVPNKYFGLFVGYDGYLRTGRGDICREENKIIISTKNSVYTFTIYKRKTLPLDITKIGGSEIIH